MDAIYLIVVDNCSWMCRICSFYKFLFVNDFKPLMELLMIIKISEFEEEAIFKAL